MGHHQNTCSVNDKESCLSLSFPWFDCFVSSHCDSYYVQELQCPANKDFLKWYRVFGVGRIIQSDRIVFLGYGYIHAEELPWKRICFLDVIISSLRVKLANTESKSWAFPFWMTGWSSQLVQDFSHQQQCQWPHITEILQYQEKGCKVKTCKPFYLCFFSRITSFLEIYREILIWCFSLLDTVPTRLSEHVKASNEVPLCCMASPFEIVSNCQFPRWVVGEGASFYSLDGWQVQSNFPRWYR